jgi:hypothetical protein
MEPGYGFLKLLELELRYQVSIAGQHANMMEN